MRLYAVLLREPLGGTGQLGQHRSRGSDAEILFLFALRRATGKPHYREASALLEAAFRVTGTRESKSNRAFGEHVLEGRWSRFMRDKGRRRLIRPALTKLARLRTT
jgi:hypothetical protein